MSRRRLRSLGRIELSAAILKPSPISGVGVFTLEPLREGSVVELFAEGDCVAAVGSPDDLPSALAHYVVLTEGGYWRPRDFKAMSLGWYLNHSDRPNLRRDDLDRWWTVRDVSADEELTVDYRTLDADVNNWTDERA